MKHIVSDKYNIAWFKLADCVSRGEKERALGIYRLLSHSIDDQALARQLEGDILLAFQDDSARDKYREAIGLYQQDFRDLEAAAIYEHLLMLEPETELYHLKLVELYAQLRIQSKVQEHLNILCEHALSKKAWDKAVQFSDQFGKASNAGAAACMHEQLVFALLNGADVSQDLVMDQVQKTINAWLRAGEQDNVQWFLEKLKDKDEIIYAFACDYMNQE